jgi:hypothetical protein
MLSITNFESVLSSAVLKKGEDYFKAGYVRDLEQENLEWIAIVEGNDDYEVSVSINSNAEILDTDCDCPHDTTYCKHIVAVFYAIQKELAVKVETSQSNTNKDVFGGLLMKVTLQEFRAFIKDYAKKNREFKTEFELFFASKDDRIDVAKKYQKKVDSLIKKYSDHHDFIDYRSSIRFANEIDGIISSAGSFIQKNNFVDAFLICKIVLPIVLETIEYSDDSTGSIGDTIEEIIGLIEEIATKVEVSFDLKAQIFEYLISQSSNSLYFDYGDFGYDLVRAMQMLAVQLNNEEAYINCLDRLIIKSKEDSHLSNFCVKSKIEFYELIGKPGLAFSLIENNLEIVDIRETRVKESIAAKDFVKAKSLLFDGVVIATQKAHPGTVYKWHNYLLEIAYLENDLVNIRHFTKRFAFDRGVDLKFYLKWKETFNETEWLAEIENHIASVIKIKTEEWKNIKGFWKPAQPKLLSDLASIYIQEGYFDRLMKLVRLENNLEATMSFQKYLKKDYHEELITMYLPLLRDFADRASDRGTYKLLVQHMKDIIKEIPNEKTKILALADDLKIKYSTKPRRPAMLEELQCLMK